MFVLSLVVWLLVKPLKPDNWVIYSRIDLHFSDIAACAVICNPCGEFYSRETAMMLNVWFLALFALWRVSLFSFI